VKLNNRRRLVIALGAGALTAPLAAFAQKKGKVWRIGFLEPSTAAGTARWAEALRAGLRDLGYVEGKNLVIEFRTADGKSERLPGLAAELVQLKVDVIVTHSTLASRAAKAATATIPIVMAIVADPVRTGLVASLARPGGNITGMTPFIAEVVVKRLELLKDAFPHIRQVALLFNPDTSIRREPGTIGPLGVAAASLKLELHRFGARGADEIDSAFAAMAKRRVDAVMVGDNPFHLAQFGTIAKLAGGLRLPSIGPVEFADDGGLMAYSPNRADFFRRAATLVDKIFKGARPADLPVEQATHFETVLNLKTAKALGVTFPPLVLVRATRVIE
jgi:putative ABC transport system substrate-binding protein